MCAIDDRDEIDFKVIYLELWHIIELDERDEVVVLRLDERDDDERDEIIEKRDVQQQHIEADDDDDEEHRVVLAVSNDEIDVNELPLSDTQYELDIMQLDEQYMNAIDIVCIASHQIECSISVYENKKLTACKEQSFSILFWAFNICEYNTIALYTISLIWAKRNKRNTKLSRLRRLYVSELIDDFDVWLLWREQSQNSQREEKSKWLQADPLLFGEIHTSKAFIESMTVICSEMW